MNRRKLKKEKTHGTQLFNATRLSCDAKDVKKAAELRARGNAKYHPDEKRYMSAIVLYNESLAYSPKGSEERAKSYFDRALTCLALRRFNDCLRNIQLVRATNHPATQNLLLEGYETVAKLFLDTTRTAGAELQLSYPGHEHMTHVANCLELVRHETLEKTVVTNRKLLAGDVVMIERPIFVVLAKDQQCLRCAYCFGEYPFTLIPCEGCTWAMYCSEGCMMEAYHRFHRYECGLIRQLSEDPDSRTGVTALHTIAVAISSFNSDLEALIRNIETVDKLNQNIWTMNWKTATIKDVLATMHLLMSDAQRFQYPDPKQQHAKAVLIYCHLMLRTDLKQRYTMNIPLLQKMLYLCYEYLNILQYNAKSKSILQYDLKEKVYVSKEFGVGCYPLISMLNHSCNGNVMRIDMHDGRCAMVVTRPIAEGEQLLECYGYQHLLRCRDEQPLRFLRNSSLDCWCEASVRYFRSIGMLLKEVGFNTRDSANDIRLMHTAIADRDAKIASMILQKQQQRLNDTTRVLGNFELIHRGLLLKHCYAMLYGDVMDTDQYTRFW
uniref:MYND-type domain-containing protein n=1 Tax=Anopheles christyi TaxID=43041 RepID=A0A182KDP6_9DIPT